MATDGTMCLLRMTSDTRANHAIVKTMGLETVEASEWAVQRSVVESVSRDELIVDALLGTGFRGEVRSPMAELIDALNAADTRAIVAVDVPSGLDCDTGMPSNATVRAELTVTFVASKAGFSASTAARFVGRIEVVDIGTPRELLAQVAAEDV